MASVNNEVRYTISLKDLFTSAIKKAKGETDQLDESVKKVQGSANSLGGTMGRIFAGVSMGLFAKSVYDVGTGFENAEMGLKTLLKTETAARDEFNAIMEDAQKTPFDFKSLLMANRALISSGVEAEEARDHVKALANAVSATGGGVDELQRMAVNLMQIKSLNQVMGRDLNQFAYANINIYKLLEASTGKTKAQLENTTVTYDMLIKALQDARKEGGMFAGGLENAMNTVAGRTSNLGDKFDLLKFKIFNMSKDGLNTAIDGLAKFIETIERVVEWNRPAIQSLIEFTKNLAEGLAPALKMVYGLLQFTFSITVGLVTWFNKLGIAGKALIAFAGSFVVGLWAWNKAVVALTAVQTAYNAVAAVGAALSGNWAGLAVAGVIALAGATWYLIDAQKEYNKQKKAGSSGAVKPSLMSASKTKTAAPVTPIIPAASTPTTKTEAPKYTQININISKMQASENLYIESGVKQSENQIANKVLEMLTGALNDSQRMAGAH